jgi:rare lipoprotein A
MQTAMRKPALIALAMIAAASAARAEPAPAAQPVLFSQTGRASYYDSALEGNETADGSVFDGSAFTAAHRSLPFGTVVRVTNVANGRTVKVRVNDRGPFTRRLVIDLSEAAARELGMFRRGIARVTLKVLRADQP